MPEYNTIREYLHAVESQIRWKRARSAVTPELEQHLLDQKEAFLQEGHSDAEAMAVAEMGDPVELGLQFDRLHRPRPQVGLLALTVLLAFVSVFLRIWLTAGWTDCGLNIDPVITMASLFLGCAALFAGYFFDYTLFLCHVNKLYLISLVIGGLSLLLSPQSNGSSYYTPYVTFFYPIVYAAWIYHCRDKGTAGLFRAIVGWIPLELICVMAHSTCSFVFLFMIGMILLLFCAAQDWFGIGKKRSLLLILCSILVLASILFIRIFSSAPSWARIISLLQPEIDPEGYGYAAITTQKILSRSVWLGEGYAPELLSQFPYEQVLPACNSDLLLTTLIYRQGWFPFLVLVSFFTTLIAWGFARCTRQHNKSGKLIASTILLLFAMRIIASLAQNMGYPVFSVSFPLMMGNLQMVLDLGMLGILFSVFRSDSIAALQKNPPSDPFFCRRNSETTVVSGQ